MHSCTYNGVIDANKELQTYVKIIFDVLQEMRTEVRANIVLKIIFTFFLMYIFIQQTLNSPQTMKFGESFFVMAILIL